VSTVRRNPVPPIDEPGTDHIADPVVPTVSAWNIANGLTVLRLVLVPLFTVALFGRGGHDTQARVTAFVIFFVASVTDLVDGDIARKRNLITEFGKLMDPIADKALMGAALVGLSLLHDLPWWVTIVILTREIGVTLLRFWVINHGVIPASRGGKLKTLLQALAIGMFVLGFHGAWRVAAWIVMSGAIAMTALTGLDYVRRAVVLRRRSLEASRRPDGQP